MPYRFARAASGPNNPRRASSTRNRNQSPRFRLRDGRCRSFSCLRTAAESPRRWWRIDVDDSGLEIAHGLKGLVHVARVDGGGQSILHAVGDLDGLIERRTESRPPRGRRFLPARWSSWDRIRENCGLVEPAVRQIAGLRAVAAGQQSARLRLSRSRHTSSPFAAASRSPPGPSRSRDRGRRRASERLGAPRE